MGSDEKMLEFIGDETVRVVVEMIILILTTGLSFLGGCTYTNNKTKKMNEIRDINSSKIDSISQKNR